MKTHPERGRGCVGPRARTVDRDEILGRREIVMRQPASQERSAALTNIRQQLRNIENRTDRTKGQ